MISNLANAISLQADLLDSAAGVHIKFRLAGVRQNTSLCSLYNHISLIFNPD